MKDKMNKQRIDSTFISDLRIYFGRLIWNFDSKKTNIIPIGFEHEQLMQNHLIDESILKYYFMPTSNILTNAEFQKMVNHGFVGNKVDTLNPYPFIIYGAFLNRLDLIIKLEGLAYRKFEPSLNGYKVEYFSDLEPYFREYAKGFEEGFNEFEKKNIEPFLPMFPDKKDFIFKVFEYITKTVFFSRGWGLVKGFTINKNNEIIEAFENGQYHGYFYRAWSIILSNNNLFAPLFQEHLKNKSRQSTKVEQSLTFEDMFKFPELIQDCIDVLKQVEPPILNDDEKYIGKLKSSFCVWIDILLRKGLIKTYSDRSIYSKLISEKFTPFSIDESMFGKYHKRANYLYQLEFDTLLSQVSQKESRES